METGMLSDLKANWWAEMDQRGWLQNDFQPIFSDLTGQACRREQNST